MCQSEQSLLIYQRGYTDSFNVFNRGVSNRCIIWLQNHNIFFTTCLQLDDLSIIWRQKDHNLSPDLPEDICYSYHRCSKLTKWLWGYLQLSNSHVAELEEILSLAPLISWTGCNHGAIAYPGDRAEVPTHANCRHWASASSQNLAAIWRNCVSKCSFSAHFLMEKAKS